MAVVLNEIPLWPDVEALDIEYTRDLIEVTTFGDVDRQYAPGPVTRCTIRITCEPGAAQRLLEFLGSPPPRPADPAADYDPRLVKRRVRLIEA